jgi:hypothetical protein
MALYFFDTRDNGSVMRDDIGLEFPNLRTVKTQASLSLAELAHDVLPGKDRRTLGIDVRDDHDTAVMTAELVFEARLLQ